ncbi:MAG: ArsR/SmtB family transcription factor [bacterium]
MESEELKSKAMEASSLLSSMSNEKRLMILCQLTDGERSVSELAEQLDVRQSTISQHLALLRKDGLVSSRRDAQTQYYSLVGDAVKSILETLYSIYCAPGKKK